MNHNDSKIFLELERLAAAFPWQGCDIWVKREPEGKIHYTIYVTCRDDLGLASCCNDGQDLTMTVDRCIKQYAEARDPAKNREAKIAELKETIAKMEAVCLGMPPYVPNRELSQFVSQHTIDLESDCTTTSLDCVASDGCKVTAETIQP